jgi:hypothetical protein
MSGPGEDRIEALQLAVDRLTQGLTLMLETQSAQTEMLRQLLEAVAAPVPEESPVAAALRGVIAAVQSQSDNLRLVHDDLDRLPEKIGREVAEGLRAALKAASL